MVYYTDGNNNYNDINIDKNPEKLISGNIMLIDFGSTYTKVTGISLEDECILGTAKAFTTIKEGICIGLEKAIHALEKETKVTTWKSKLGCSSAAGGLRMIAVGLVKDLTVQAAKEAALSAGAKILKVYSMELTREDILEIETLKPDIVLLTGGTDGGNQKVVIHNAKMLAKVEALFPLIYSGNRNAKEAVTEVFKDGNKEVFYTKNVMPSFGELCIEEAREAIRHVFLKRIIVAKGIKEAENLIDNVLMPTPMAVMQGAYLLACGIKGESGLGDLLVVDIGGATTDIHSVCDGHPSIPNVVLKGIEEPFVKRSVEGDLGARYSLASTVELIGRETLMEGLKLSDAALDAILYQLEEDPGYTNDTLNAFEQYIAKAVTKESVKRHAGRLKEHFTPFGLTYEQNGKDLTGVRTIIGTGGPIIHSGKPKEILKEAGFDMKIPFSLRPKLESYYIDKYYILAAMGLLAEVNPLCALRILKKNCVKLVD